jgi:hypothetical protein
MEAHEGGALAGAHRISGAIALLEALTTLLVVTGLWAVSAWADDLPTNLLLKCEGKDSVTWKLEGSRPDFVDKKFETMLRLKDGELSDTSLSQTTKGCALRNGIVHCSAKSVAPSIDSGSWWREVTAYIFRETGEYNLFINNRRFAGANASGKQNGNMSMHRSGICRDVGKPIF